MLKNMKRPVGTGRSTGHLKEAVEAVEARVKHNISLVSSIILIRAKATLFSHGIMDVDVKVSVESLFLFGNS